jgi:hypothetical protein
MLATLGLACKNSPKREMRPPSVQMYDLPDLNQKQFSEAPIYPEEKVTIGGNKKTGIMQPGGGAGMAGGMPSPGMPGGPGGTNGFR